VLPEFSILYELLDISQGVTLSPHSSSAFFQALSFYLHHLTLTQDRIQKVVLTGQTYLVLEWRNTGFALSDTSQSSQSDSDDMPTLLTEDSQILIWMTQALTWVILIRTPGMMVMMKKWGHIPRLSRSFGGTYQGIFFALLDAPWDKPIPKAPPQLPPCSHRA